jgi:conjugal transfer mating pair stabilization protein TraN
MWNSLSKLHVLKEMQQDLKSQPFVIFKGQDLRCSKRCLGFSDCCGLSGGWGESLKMTSCKGEEKELSQRRGRGLCHFIGTYCAEKEGITGVCLRKKTSYCCFPSKLVRLLQEQGRRQLSLGWGEAPNPSCRGLTVEELQRIDFSKIDAREVFEEIASAYRPGKQEEYQEAFKKKTFESLKTHMDHLKSGLKHSGVNASEPAGGL